MSAKKATKTNAKIEVENLQNSKLENFFSRQFETSRKLSICFVSTFQALLKNKQWPFFRSLEQFIRTVKYQNNF